MPDDWQAEALAREGVSRGRIWTARELGALVALPDRTPEIVQRLALAKRAVDGDNVEVRRPGAHPPPRRDGAVAWGAIFFQPLHPLSPLQL